MCLSFIELNKRLWIRSIFVSLYSRSAHVHPQTAALGIKDQSVKLLSQAQYFLSLLQKHSEGVWMCTDHPCFSDTTMDSCGTSQGAARLPSIWMLYLVSVFWEAQCSPSSRWSDAMNKHNATLWKLRNYDSQPAALKGTGHKQTEVFHIKGAPTL